MPYLLPFLQSTKRYIKSTPFFQVYPLTRWPPQNLQLHHLCLSARPLLSQTELRISPPMITAMKMSQVTSVRSHCWYSPPFTWGLKASQRLNEYGDGETFSKLPHQAVTSMPKIFFFFLIKIMGKTESTYLSNASKSWQKSHCSSFFFFFFYIK